MPIVTVEKGATAESEAQSRSGEVLRGKSILFVNSGFSRRRFIFQRAKQLGVEIILLNKEPNWANRYADHFIQADPFQHEECLEKLGLYLKEKKLDGAVTFWEDDVPLVAKLCRRFGWVGNSYQSVICCRNKYRMREILSRSGLSATPFRLVHSSRSLGEAIEVIGLPAVLKPVWGSLSQFVVKVETREEAENVLDYIRSNLSPQFDPIYRYGTQIMYERYLPGAEVDVDLLLQNGEIRFYSVTDNFPTREPFFVETGDAMPSRHEERDLEAVLDLVRRSVRAIGLKYGAIHVEAKITPQGPQLVEVNARMGGDYIWDWVRGVWGVDLVEEALQIAVGAECRPQKPQEPRMHLVGKYLIPESSGVIAGIVGTNGENRRNGVHEVAMLKEIGDAVLTPPEGFDVMGWVVGQGDTYSEAEQSLEEALQGIDIRIVHFDSTSSIGKTRRKNRFSSASIARRRILQSARLERIRGTDLGQLTGLKLGILCNKYEGSKEEESAIHQDLMSVGMNIQKALETRGFQTSFVDMNETPLPFEKVAEANLDIVFNVCERINNSSLLEPHAAAVLDCLGIPYTGSNPLTLALCIDKIKVKKILRYNKIPTPNFDYVFNVQDRVREDLRFPLIVKPANTDNSIGIGNESVVTCPKELKERIEYVVRKIKRPALIEEFIEGDEVDVSVLGNEENVRVLPLSRSVFEELPEGVWHIYPFKAKWEKDSVYDKIRTERPAKYSQKLTQLISEITLDVYNIFDCHDYARVEFRVDKEGNPYVLEVNPNPSINRGDCIPACAELIGLSYEDFILEVLKAAILRYKERPPYYHLQSVLSP
ncbi:MAG: ATP-grasp domain-containing protein [Elusimicrobia bacterium]|nr:ATP-grasp domain-containing protein [Elusimicrobiota bacterium]